MPFDQCDKTVDMSVDYRYFAHATFDTLNKVHWKRISLVFDGNQTLSNVSEPVSSGHPVLNGQRGSRGFPLNTGLTALFFSRAKLNVSLFDIARLGGVG